MEKDDGFVSPFLKGDKLEEIVTVHPKEPTKRPRAAYLLQDESGRCGRNYVSCSACQHRSFKQFRHVYSSMAPEHLKKHAHSNNELLKFCRSCWFNTDEIADDDKAETGSCESPYFERSSLGITDKRACFGWHFIQRDFVRRRFEENKRNVPNDSGQDATTLLPLATVLVRNGSEFSEKCDGGSLFDWNGRETSLSESNVSDSEAGSELAITKETEREKQKNEMKLSEVLRQIRKDHDYAPCIQKEIEIKTTTGMNQAKKNNTNNNNNNSNVKSLNISTMHGHNNTKRNVSRVEKVEQMNTKNVLKKVVEYNRDGSRNVESKLATIPIHKAEEEMKKLRDKNGKLDPAHLIGLKATSESGQTLPGLICPFCGKHTVKSYSVWRKNNAPAMIEGLFKDGISVIRACRRCVPYPVDKKEKKPEVKNASSKKKLKNNPIPMKAKSDLKSPRDNNNFYLRSCVNTSTKDARIVGKLQAPRSTLQVEIEAINTCNGFSPVKGQVQIKGAVTEVKSDVAKVKCDVAKVKSDAEKVKFDATKVKGDAAKAEAAKGAIVKSGVTQVKHDIAKVKFDATKVEGDSAKVKADVAKGAIVKSGVVQVKGDVAKLKCEAIKVKGDAAKVKVDVAKGAIVKSGVVQVKGDLAKFKCDATKVKGDAAKVKVDVAKGAIVKSGVVQVKGDVTRPKGDSPRVNINVAELRVELSKVKVHKLQYGGNTLKRSGVTNSQEAFQPKKAKVDEERKKQLSKRQPLTGLECFEMLTTDES
eukprot:gene4540-5137_t